MSIESVIAKRLTDSGKVITAKHNTVFTAVNEYSMHNPIVEKACTGLAVDVTNDINLYRNVILPVTLELELEVKNKSKGGITTINDKVNIHTLNKGTGLDLLTELDRVDPLVTAVVTDLPSSALHIEYDDNLVKENIALSNNRVKQHVDEILAEYDEGYLEEVHRKLFGSLSNANPFIRSINVNLIKSYNEIFLSLAMTLGYINGTLGVSNVPTNDVRNMYLYTLRDILTNTLVMYSKRYRQYLDQDILIARVTTGDKGTKEVVLIGETYSKYLDDNRVDPIIGYASAVTDSSSVTLSNFVKDIARYQEQYDTSIRMASMQGSINHINMLRLSYKIVTRDFVRNMSDNELDIAGITKDLVNGVCDAIDEYIDTLESDKLLEVTNVIRYVVGYYIYADKSFLDFVKYMTYYNTIFPKCEVNEIATAAMIAILMDKLEPQLTVGSVANTRY